MIGRETVVGRDCPRRVRTSRTILTLALLVLLPACDPDMELLEVVVIDDAPRFQIISTESIYLPMRDGVDLAVDVVLPEPREPGLRLPTIVEMTRYWRAVEGEGTSNRIERMALRGYAYVIVDERGTGASFGTWSYPWSDDSLDDLADVVDWIIEQDWSNGLIGAFGVSYPGMNAQRMAALSHPAIRAVIPQYTQFDVYTDIGFPGGIFLEWFVRNWSELALTLDQNQWPDQAGLGVKPVDRDRDGSELQAALIEHAGNGDVFEGFRNVVFRDDMTSLGITMDDISPHRLLPELARTEAAIYAWGSWMDHTSAHSVITRFLTLDSPQRVVIGAWPHGAAGHASPFVPVGTGPNPDQNTQLTEVLNFFDRYLKQADEEAAENVLFYYTMGEEKWKSTPVWPVQGVERESWYLGPGETLTPGKPVEASGRDEYAVDFSATTGDFTRWHTPLGRDTVWYRDRRVEDRKLLTYTSDPLGADIEITGYPVATLYVSSTHDDGAFYVYLEDVAPDGTVTYLTEGQLRALHRKVSPNAPYETLIPYHSFESVDAEPLIAGEISELCFGLQPVSVLVRKGHRIRVAIAGHDNGLFARIPTVGDPVVSVERSPSHPSSIEVPVIRR